MAPTRDRRAFVAALGGAIWLAGCGDAREPPFEPVAFEDVTMTLFRPFAAGTYVFRSRDELLAALAAAPFQIFPIGLVTEAPAVPAWDFAQGMIVGLSRGQGAWCSAPRIREVLGNGTETEVRYMVAAFGTLACQRLAPRIGFARVPRATGRVAFIEVPA